MIAQVRSVRDDGPAGIDPFGTAPGPAAPSTGGARRRPDPAEEPRPQAPGHHERELGDDPFGGPQDWAGIGPQAWHARMPWAPDAAFPSAPDAAAPSRRPTWVMVLMAVIAGLLVAGAIVAGERLLAARPATDDTLAYPVPAGWLPGAVAPGSTAGGVTLGGVVTVGGYGCRGHRRNRATVGHSFVVRGDGRTARTEDAARDFGLMFARSFYAVPAEAAAPGPTTPITVGDRTGSMSEVRVAPTDGCPVAGSVTAVALRTDRRGPRGADGVLLLVVQRDTAATPGGPALVTDQTAAALLDSVRIVARPGPTG